MGDLNQVIKKKDKDGRDIHPLTHIKKRKNKLQIVLVILSVITVVNILFIIYINFFKFEEKSLITINNPKKAATAELNPKQNNQKQKEVKNLNYPMNNISISDKDFKNIASLQIPEVNFREENNQKPQETIKSNLDNKKTKQISTVENSKETQKEESNSKEEKKQLNTKKDFAYYYSLAKKFEKIRDLKSAIFYYRKAYKLNPDPDILYKIAYLNYRVGAYRGAIKYSKIILKEFPKYIDAYLLIANSYLKEGKTDLAKLTLEEAYYKFPENKKIIFKLANICEKTGNPYAAIELYEGLAKENDIKAIIKIANLYEKIGENKKALEYYKKAFSIDNGTYKDYLTDKINKLKNIN